LAARRSSSNRSDSLGVISTADAIASQIRRQRYDSFEVKRELPAGST
jgi:hypothetical protein